ncbi:MAG: hypothetical protein WA162_07330 [Thermodesulfobacteriota bacterium]
MRFLKRIPFYPAVSLIFIAAILPFAFGVLPTVHFTSERIDVRVYPDEIFVDGYYFYKNPFPFPIVQGFSIPFPIDKDHPEPFDVNVERLTPAKKTLRLRRIFGKTGFEAYFSAKEEAEIRVSYRQKAGSANGAYILTTTRPWGRPLENGVYTLYPYGTIIVSSNYPFNLPGNAPGFRMTGFMPEKDWQFTWRRENGKEE